MREDHSEAAPIKCAGRESAGRPTDSLMEGAGRPTDSQIESVGKPADSLPSYFIGAASDPPRSTISHVDEDLIHFSY